MRTTTQKGFTLVELAIVMTIIGLLIGGILKGQEMIANARVTATIAQVKAIEAATTTFRDAYSGMPGDLVNAQQRVPGCTDRCGLLLSSGTAGNGIVGIQSWGGTPGATFVGTPQITMPAAPSGTPPAGASVEASEPVLFWAQLSAARLLSGVTTNSINGTVTAPSWGDTHPAAKIGGGFVVGHSQGGFLPGVMNGTTVGNIVSGTVLVMLDQPGKTVSAGAAAVPGGAAAVASSAPIAATKAAQIDRKMDDGIAYSGSVQAYGAQANASNHTGCANATGGTTSTYTNYEERSTGNTCGLVFQIQG